MIEVQQIPASKWVDTFSENSHAAVFGERLDPTLQRIDFALIAGNGRELITYATCKELDSESLYFQYGGSYPKYRGSPMVSQAFGDMIKWVEERYKRLSFLVENDNKRMLRLAAKHDFKICGIRHFKGKVLLEHAKGDC